MRMDFRLGIPLSNSQIRLFDHRRQVQIVISLATLLTTLTPLLFSRRAVLR